MYKYGKHCVVFAYVFCVKFIIMEETHALCTDGNFLYQQICWRLSLRYDQSRNRFIL